VKYAGLSAQAVDRHLVRTLSPHISEKGFIYMTVKPTGKPTITPLNEH